MSEPNVIVDSGKKPKQVSTQLVAVAFLVLLLGGGAVISYLSTHKSKAEVAQPCVAGPNEKCPPEDWMKSYEEFQAAQAKLKSDMESKGITERQRMLAGWAQDLGKAIPTQEGYSFDEKTHKWVKPALPPTPSQTPEPKKP